MLGNFNPSVIVNKIYDILEDYEVKTDVYNHEAVNEIADYFEHEWHIEYNLCCSDWPNEEGGVCGIAFVDCGHPQLVMFDYEY
jgi:hypothetical protein